MTPSEAMRLAATLIARLDSEAALAIRIMRLLCLRPEDAASVVRHIRDVRKAREQELSNVSSLLMDLNAQAEHLLMRRLGRHRHLHVLISCLTALGEWAHERHGVSRLTNITEEQALSFMRDRQSQGCSRQALNQYERAIKCGLGLLKNK